jgi:2-polyprenyl-3-methyl-5-hydroxy-6-metoxy-1,4-benzoquinol methylase
MKMWFSGGDKENGIVFGNVYDKYGSSNPIVKWIMKNFESTLSELVAEASPVSIHEVGCGEGYWVLRWAAQGFSAKGSDLSMDVIKTARNNAIDYGFSPSLFASRSIYELVKDEDEADLIVCCEVLEHMENPEAGLMALQRVVRSYLIVSVPREPLWCVLNFARGKYIIHLGNTPGHVQHWSAKGFLKLVSRYFDVIETKSPLPWTMLLCRPYS